MRPSHYHSRTRDDLTGRQHDVLALVAKGKTNREIAEALGMTLDGAKFHVSEILSKLGVSTREEAAAWWKEQRSVRSRAVRGVAWLTGSWRWLAVGGSAAILAAGAVIGGSAIASHSSGGDAGDVMLFRVTPPDASPEIVAYSPASQRIVSTHNVPATVDGGQYNITSAGPLLLFTSSSHITSRTRAGSPVATLYTDRAGWKVMAIRPSPDGSAVAIVTAKDDISVATVMAVDTNTGRSIVSVTRTDSAFLDIFRQGFTLTWRDDSSGFTVMRHVAGNDSAQRPYATVGLNATVKVGSLPAGRISPDGRYLSFGYGSAAQCPNEPRVQGIKIVDLASGETVASLDNGIAGVQLFQWSLDGTAATFQQYDSPDCNSDASFLELPADGGPVRPQVWHRSSPAVGTSSTVAADAAVAIEIDCGYPSPVTMPVVPPSVLGPLGGDCTSFAPDTNTPEVSSTGGVGTLLVNGHAAFKFESFEFLGIAPQRTD
jgi:DNA-binding CsgD family transcriptional regulator